MGLGHGIHRLKGGETDPLVFVLPDPVGVSRLAADMVTRAIRIAALRGRRCFLAMSGGSTPAALYHLMATPTYNDLVPWTAVHLLWGDERCVPPDDPRSNYHLVEASGLLVRRLGGVHRMPGELPPEEGADAYEAELHRLFPEGSLPVLDMVLLGMGEDGHVASLFPGSPELDINDRWVVATGPHDDSRRITLTLPVLLAAQRILFLVTGEAKARAVADVLEEARPELPAAHVAEAGSRVTFLLDRSAAQSLC